MFKTFIIGVCLLGFASLASEQPLGLSRGGKPDRFTVNAWNFNGSSWLTRNSDLTGNADSKLGIVSAWVKSNVDTGTHVWFGTHGSTVVLFRDAAGHYNYILRNDAGDIAEGGSTTTFSAASGWHHILMAWDTAANPVIQLYIDDTLESTAKKRAAASQLVDYTRTQHQLGAVSGTQRWNGCMGQVYINFAETMDLTVTANRRKFISATGKPVDLGIDGSVPTGTRPIVFFKDPVASIETNSGSGGTFSGGGSFTACSSSPSD